MNERTIRFAVDAWVARVQWVRRKSKHPRSPQPYPRISVDEVLEMRGISWDRDRFEYAQYEREIRPRALARLREEAAA